MSWWRSGRARLKRYRPRHFRSRDRFRDDYRRLARHLIDELRFDTAFDVGCANGFLIEEFLAAGKRSAGIELSPAVLEVLSPALAEVVRIGDFTEAEGSWDLVVCIEVAEHIDPRRSRELVATATRLAERWLLFSAAPPGQMGRGHVNCRPHEEWLGWLAEAGWEVDRFRTDRLRAAVHTLETVPWLESNSYLLRPAAG